MEVRPEGLVLTEIAPGYTVEQVRAATDAALVVYDDLKVMDIGE